MKGKKTKRSRENQAKSRYVCEHMWHRVDDIRECSPVSVRFFLGLDRTECFDVAACPYDQQIVSEREPYRRLADITHKPTSSLSSLRHETSLSLGPGKYVPCLTRAVQCIAQSVRQMRLSSPPGSRPEYQSASSRTRT